ncbi:MAG: hypothetical protein JW932_09210 [Deltaproteobacteria bacterium]|nr:hypothetical protein [Deltaproteobacteria bacterium]
MCSRICCFVRVALPHNRMCRAKGCLSRIHEARNFQNTDKTASVLEIQEGYEKVAQRENLEGAQGAAMIEMKPTRFVKAASLPIGLYPG